MMVSKARNQIAQLFNSAALALIRRSKNRRVNAVWVANRSWEYLQRKNPDDAIFWAEAAIAADPHLADGYRMLGYAYLRVGKRDEAGRAYEEGLLAVPDDPLLLRSFADFRREEQLADEAEQLYRRSLALQWDPYVCLMVAELTARRKAYAEAAELLEEGLQHHPGDPRNLALLASMYSRLGRHDQAVGRFHEASLGEPLRPIDHYDLARSLLELGRVHEALEHARSAYESDPDDPYFQRLLSLVEERMA